MWKTWDEIVKDYELVMNGDGTYDTSHITDQGERDYVEKRIAVQGKINAAEREAKKAAAEARTVGQVSGEMEHANNLYAKIRKYMPTMIKQAGMDGLGVSQSMVLRAQDDFSKNMAAASSARGSRVDSALNDIWGSYKSYVDSLNPEIDAAEQELFDVRLGENKSAVDKIYGDYSLDAAGRQAAVDSLLSGVSDANMKNSIGEYVAGLESKAAVIDKLQALYASAPAENGVTLDDYKEAAAGGSLWDRMTPEEQEELFEWYQGLSGEDRLTADEYFEYIKTDTVGDRIEMVGEADDAAMAQLSALGIVIADGDGGYSFSENATAADIQAFLGDERFAGISNTLRQTLVKAAETAKNAGYAINEASVKELLEAVDPATLDEAGAEAYYNELGRYLNEDKTPNLDLISEKFYNSHLKPELDQLDEVWDAYRTEAKRISDETYAKQMAGEKQITDTNGKKWYVANSPERDVESFMKENEEAVNEALGEFGNVKNPSIPNNTVIEVGGVNLIYDKAGDAWKYAIDKPPNNRFEYQSASGKVHRATYYIVNGKEKKIREVENEKLLNSINEVELGEKAKNGKVLTIKIDGKGREFVLFNGKWYHTTYAQWYKYE